VRRRHRPRSGARSKPSLRSSQPMTPMPSIRRIDAVLAWVEYQPARSAF
jgi:hypothetical protein